MTKKGLNNDGDAQQALYDYGDYKMKLIDRVLAFAIGFLAAAIVMHIFFGNLLVDLIAGIAVGIVA